MVVAPKIRGFICTTAHPTGCAKHVANQIAVVKNRGPITNAPKKVLVIGASGLVGGAFHAAGVPEAIFQNLVLDHATTATLISEKSFGFINFTGSVPGGKAIEQAAAGTLISFTDFTLPCCSV